MGDPSLGEASSGEKAGASQFTQNAMGAGGAFSLGASAWNGPTVYYGTVPEVSEYETQGRRATGRGVKPGTPVWITPQKAYEDYFRWTPKQRQDLLHAGIISGQLQEDAGDMQAAAWWKSLVEQAARYGAAGQQVSPMDLAGGYVGNAGLGLSDQQRFQMQRGLFPAGAIFDSSGKYTRTYREGQFVVNELTGQRSYVGPQFKTQTQTRTDMTDPATAKALTTSIFQQLIGRNPGPGELEQFANALSAAEKSSPVTETTTSQYNELGEVISQTSTQQGGLTAAGKQQMLEEQLRKTKEYGVQQAGTTYAEATKRAIWGGPGA